MASKLKQLQDRRVAVQKLMRETNDAIPDPPSATASDEDRAAVKIKQDELQAKFDALKTELGEVQAALTREEELQEIERAMIPSGNGSTGQATPVSHGDTVPAKAKGEEPKPWRSLGEQLVAVAAAGDKPSDMWDPRLQKQAAITGMGETIGSEGGHLVQQDFVAGLLERTWASNQGLGGGNRADHPPAPETALAEHAGQMLFEVRDPGIPVEADRVGDAQAHGGLDRRVLARGDLEQFHR